MRWLIVGLALTLLTAPARSGEAVKLINIGAVNTKADETDPFVASNNAALVYATNAAGSFDIYVSYRSSGAWKKGAPLPGYDDKIDDERSPYIFNTSVYFATNFVPDEKFKDLKNFDIKVVTQGRAPLELLGISTREDELHPWIHQGRELYFSRKSADGWVQHVATGPSPGPIGSPKSVGFAPGFHNASLTTDGKTMYLEGPIDEKRTRLFVATRGKEGWSKPRLITNLSEADAQHSDAGPALSPDGRYIYFTSNREGGQGGWDIYAVAVSSLKTAE